MPALTELQIAAALSEQAYHRSEQDQQLNDSDIGVSDERIVGFIEQAGGLAH